MSLKKETKALLESVFGISFDVTEKYDHGSPELCIFPTDSEERLFSLTISFQNSIRMNTVFEPQKYAVQMVREMGHADAGKKLLFCEYAAQSISAGAKLSLRINDIPMDFKDFSGWPTEWSKISIRSSVVPIAFDAQDNPDYSKTLLQWLPLIMGMSLSLLTVEKLDLSGDDANGRLEGRKYEVTTSKYERSPINRTLCLSINGYSCKVCGFNFEDRYGVIGREYIQVHHVIPVSRMGEGYKVNPAKDLIPVCPNCHAMLHRSDPPIAPEKLRELLK